MTKFFRLFLFISCINFALSAAGQSTQKTTISGNFTGMSFGQFVEQVERVSPHRFFYNLADVDSLRVTGQATD